MNNLEHSNFRKIKENIPNTDFFIELCIIIILYLVGHICIMKKLTNVLPQWSLPYRRHRTWHPTPSQYTETGPTYRCVIH